MQNVHLWALEVVGGATRPRRDGERWEPGSRRRSRVGAATSCRSRRAGSSRGLGVLLRHGGDPARGVATGHLLEPALLTLGYWLVGARLCPGRGGGLGASHTPDPPRPSPLLAVRALGRLCSRHPGRGSRSWLLVADGGARGDRPLPGGVLVDRARNSSGALPAREAGTRRRRGARRWPTRHSCRAACRHVDRPASRMAPAFRSPLRPWLGGGRRRGSAGGPPQTQREASWP